MAWPVLTHDEYEALGGTATEEAFSAALPWAVRAVRAECWPNEPSSDAQEAAARAAYVAAVEADIATGGTHGTDSGGSFSIGGYSESAGEGGGRAAIAGAIAQALAGSGLTCRVVL